MTDKQTDTTAASFAWQGRIDREDPAHSRRVHQQHLPTPARDDFQHRPVLLGFACDEGVRRNQGVPGAALGPNAIRSALANLTCPADFGFYDLGDTVCHPHRDGADPTTDCRCDQPSAQGRQFAGGIRRRP